MPDKNGNYTPEELVDNYRFSDDDRPPLPPAGYDPEAEPFREPAQGWHIVQIPETSPYTLATNKRNGDFIGNQLNLRLEIVEGGPDPDSVGATGFDFIPVPTPGAEMPRTQANRWGQLMRAFGWNMKDEAGHPILVPPGFQFHHLRLKRAWVLFETSINDKGDRRVSPAMFGYRPLSQPPTANDIEHARKAAPRTWRRAGAAAAAATPAPTTPPVASGSSAAPLDLAGL